MQVASQKPAEFALEPTTRQVRLFRNGANQALRIPKEFELPGKEALIHREGNRLIIEAVMPRHEKGSAAALLAALEEIAKLGPFEDEFPDVNASPLPLDGRTCSQRTV